VIANNICNCTRTSSSNAIYLRDDSTGGSNDPLQLADVIVTGNVVYSLTGGIQLQTSRGIIGWNTVRLAGTSSANAAITLTNHGNVRNTDNIVIGNLISVIDGQTGVNISLIGQINALVSSNLIRYDTGASGSTDAIQFLNCQESVSDTNVMRNLPGRGVRFTNCRDMISMGDITINACIASGNAGAFTDNTGSGYYLFTGGVYVGGMLPPAAPTVTASGAGSTLAAGTYLCYITYTNPAGETTVSASSSVTITAGQNIVYTTPIAAGNANGWKIYMTAAGGAAGTETLQGGVNPIGTNVTLTAQAAGTAIPASNTTSKMSFCINNQGTPATVYRASNIPLGTINTGNTTGATTAVTTF